MHELFQEVIRVGVVHDLDIMPPNAFATFEEVLVSTTCEGVGVDDCLVFS